MRSEKMTNDEMEKRSELQLQQEFAAVYWWGDMTGKDKEYTQLIVNERIRRGESQADIDRQLDQLYRLGMAKTNLKKRKVVNKLQQHYIFIIGRKIAPLVYTGGA